MSEKPKSPDRDKKAEQDSPKSQRAERLSETLRGNLAKRKKQARARRDGVDGLEDNVEN